MLLQTLILPLLLGAALAAVVGALSISEQTVLSTNKNTSYEHICIESLNSHPLRVGNPESSLCDPTVRQHAGFLDITDGKHMFFWFFEARLAPKDAPLTLWLSGGPGGSSTIGMLTTLGPCNIASGGNGTTFNPYSWNTHSNMIFLDQPVNVGYSYSSDNSSVDNSPDAAEDVYAFLQLFFDKYPEYRSAPFHIAAESYGGTFGPHTASVIHRKNKELADTSGPGTALGLNAINLASVILANPYTDPLIQHPSVPYYVCDGPYALLASDSQECEAWRAKVPECERLIQECYDLDTPSACAPAAEYCDNNIFSKVNDLGRSIYDVRKICDTEHAGLDCYPEFGWMQTWLNKSATKLAIGIDPSLNFQLTSNQIGIAFDKSGDPARNSAGLLAPLIEDGIRLLVYAGMMDMTTCNYIGTEAWLRNLDTSFRDELTRNKYQPWVTLQGGVQAGEVRYAGGCGKTAGNVTLVKVYDAGHMVPYDQPEAALDLFSRWIFNKPIHSHSSDHTYTT